MTDNEMCNIAGAPEDFKGVLYTALATAVILGILYIVQQVLA